MEATARATAPEDGATQPAAHDGFQIAATASFHEIRPRTLKHNDTFAVFDHSGDINNWPGSSEGLYRRDTRHLSHYFLTLNGGIRPILLSSSIRDDNSVLTCDLSNPDIKNAAGEQVLQNDLIHLRRTRFIFDAKLYERLTLTNFCTGSCPISLELHFAGDFADLFEVRGATRSHRGTMLAPEVSADSVALGYTGLDDLTRRTRISFDPAPAFLSENLAVFRFDLPPAKRTSILIEIDCEDKVETQDEPLRYRLLRSYRDTRQDLRNNSSRAAAVASSNEVFNQTVRRCVADAGLGQVRGGQEETFGIGAHGRGPLEVPRAGRLRHPLGIPSRRPALPSWSREGPSGPAGADVLEKVLAPDHTRLVE